MFKWLIIVRQTFEISLTSNVWPFGHVIKQCLTSSIHSALFLKSCKNMLYLYQAKNVWQAMFCVFAKQSNIVFDKQISNVWETIFYRLPSVSDLPLMEISSIDKDWNWLRLTSTYLHFHTNQDLENLINPLALQNQNHQNCPEKRVIRFRKMSFLVFETFSKYLKMQRLCMLPQNDF